MVAQRRRDFHTLLTRSGIRASQRSVADLVRPAGPAFSQPVAIADLCLLDSAELEMTVPMLIQIDKLVQLIESPVFTCAFSASPQARLDRLTLACTALRLQLLEPERYPYLLKAMYGLLMLLPQSSAFATLRNRLSAVSSLGFLQTVPRCVRGSCLYGEVD